MDKTPSIEVIRWVNDHGGVENLMRKSSHEKHRARWKERKERMKQHIAELERKCAERKLETERLRSRIDEMRPRLMPEGCEWPRYDDGEPVRFGDVVSDGDETGRVYYVTFDTVNPVIIGFTDETPDQGPGTWLEVSVNDGERVKRPEPKVFAADGKPLHEGEHVYHVETGAELVVKELPKPGEYQAVVVFAPPASHLASFDPDILTHERPETRQSIVDEIGEEMAKRIDAIVSAGRWN